MKTLIFCIKLCFWAVLLPAQTSELDLQRVLMPLSSAPFLYFENQYFYYKQGQTTPSETLKGVFHRNGQYEFIQMGATEILKTGKLLIATDHEDRVVAARMETAPSNDGALFDVAKLADLLTFRQVEVRFVSENAGIRTVQVIDPERPGDTMLIQYDHNNWIIKEASITTNDPDAYPWEKTTSKVTVVVRYQEYSIAAKAFPYKVENYIKKSGDKYLAYGKCKGYRVL